MSCLTPVVFLIYHRPDLTDQAFNSIKQAKPKQLFVVADGPKDESEVILCQQAREVTERVDWDCEVKRNYSDVNLGCRKRVSSGLDWAFRQVEEAIILEDDCLPHQSFFRFCESLLYHYRGDERIMAISGNNFQDGQRRTPYSYYFSKYNHCWGWATWQRAWKHWNFSADKWLEFRNSGLMNSVCSDPLEVQYWIKIFDAVFLKEELDSWAYVWTFACWSQSGLTALPHRNLVSNIGFGADATHTAEDSPYANLETYPIGSIYHPPFIIRNQEADQYTFDHHFGGLQIRQSKRLDWKFKRKLSNLSKKIKDFGKL